MLTGSFALAYYATPRMTRDLDFVVALTERDIPSLSAAFERDFYIDAETASAAVRSERLFNLMHLASGIKIDMIVRKADAYRQLEFERRVPVDFAGVRTWIVTREDLILSKLIWARDGKSELQLRDIRSLLQTAPDLDYTRVWAQKLGVLQLLDSLLK